MRIWHGDRGRIDQATLVVSLALCAGYGHAADVVSTFKGGIGTWSVATNWTNSPFLGGFPNNGNAGVATYDAVVSGGTLTIDTNIVIQKFTHSGGTVTGGFNLTANAVHSWTSGTLSGAGTNFDAGGLTITGTVSLVTRRLEPMVSSTLTGGSLHMGTGAVFTNQPGVTFTFLDDSSVFNDGGSPLFLNQGTVDKTGMGNGISGVGLNISRIDVPFFNHSTARASAGTLQIAGGGLTGSSLDALAGARVLLSSDYTLDGAIWSGAGTGQVSAGITTLTNNVTVAVSNFLHSGGTIGGSGNLISSGQYAWTGGTESGSGTNTLSGPLAISGTVTLSARRLKPMLSATMAGGSLHVGSGAVVENSASSSFNILDDSSVFNDGLSPSFINLGTLLKSGSGNGISGVGAGISRIDAPLTNSGTVSAQSGVLSFTANYVQTAGFTVLTGGVLSASVPMDIQGGSIIGTGTILASVTNNGTISPGFSPGALRLSGNLVCKSNSVFIIELGGTTQATEYDLVDVTNALVLAGTLQVRFINGFQSTIPPGAAFTVLIARGSLTNPFSNVASGQRLNTADGFGSFLVTYDSATKTVVLSDFTPNPVLAADFSANSTNGLAPLTVTFVNLTSGAASSYAWNFGDGTASATANPVHTYTNPGTYTVSLTAIAAGATNSITKTNLITATAPCPAPGTFSEDFSSGLRPAFWSVTQTTPGLFSVDDTHSDVRLAKTAMASPGGVQTVTIHLDVGALGGPISGDFSTQIGFRNAVVPGPGVDQVELHVHFADGSIFFLVYDNSSGTNVHVWTGSINGLTAVATNSGTFTISRTGSTLTGYFNGSPIFSEINASTLTAIEFVLQLQPGSNDSTSAAFDNFSLAAASVPLQAPTINCPTNMVLSTSPGLCSRSNLTYAVTFNDSCPDATLTQTAGLPSGSAFPKGITTNTFILTDANNNSTQCTFTVTIVDNEPPSIVCPANIVLSTDPGQCTASNVTFVVTASDNCPGVIVVCVPPSGSTFAKGVTLVTCVATDSSGNTNSCSFTVTVKDTQPPTIICPANIALSTDPGQCTASNVTFVVTASDNCLGVIVVCVPPSGSTFAKGVTLVTCVATDSSGNTNSCSFTVTVKDTQPPTITCPANIALSTDPGQCTASNVTFVVTASDNCPGVIVVCVPPSGSTFAKGVTLVTCVATDASGNTNSCSFTVTVKDTQPPSITCPANIVANAAAGANSVNVNFPAPIATDNCPGVTASCAPPSGSVFPLGDTIVTCTATDAAGNTNSCAFKVTVNSSATNTPPTITCPGNVTTNNAPGQCGRALAFFATVTGSPNPTVICKIGSNVIASPYLFPVGTNTVSCTASNVAGMANCVFTVTVNDTEPPVLTCPTNITVEAPAGQLGAVVNFVASAVDTCDGQVPVTCTPQAGYFAVGQTPVMCEATDHSGDRSMCVFIVTVNAAADPVRLCSFTPGFYGNAKGRFNGITSLVLVGQLLGQGTLVVGKFGIRSLSIFADDAALLEQRLPSGGPPAVLPDNGNQTLKTAVLTLNSKGRFRNILLGQTITLSLNVRLSAALRSFVLPSSFCSQSVLAGPDGLKADADDEPVAGDIQSFSIPASVLAALTDPVVGINDTTALGLLKLANCALAGLPTGTATLSDITEAVDAVNRGFDECRELVNCLAGPIIQDAFNDVFTNRPILDPPPPPDPLLNVRARSSNLLATKEPGEPDIAGNPGGKSVWWQWPAPVSGPITISTTGSSFDTLLGVFTGTSISNLVLLASNDDANGTLQSQVTFQAVAGTNYQIVVDGVDGASGAIVLTLIASPLRLCEPISVIGNQVQFCLTGELGRSYNVEASPDLSNWTLIATGVNTNGSFRFTDPAMSNFHHRSYRLTFEP